MMTRIELKEIEQKAHRAFRQDGLNILFAGVALGIVAVFFIDVRHGWVFALGITLAISMPTFFRRQLVHPRVGYAQFPRSKGMVRHITAICLAVVCLILFYALGKIAHFNWLMPLYLGIVFSAAALVAAMKSGLGVYYVMSFVLLLSGFVGLGFTMRGHDAGWVVAFQLWGLAVILTFAGLVQLLCFLRKYPRRSTEETNGKG
jgi:MFS family permease